MATVYARIKNQYRCKYHILFSATFIKITEEDQRKDKTELYFNLNFKHNLTETEIKNIDVKSQLEHQNQIQEKKENVWIFDKIISMKIRFIKQEKQIDQLC